MARQEAEITEWNRLEAELRRYEYGLGQGRRLQPARAPHHLPRAHPEGSTATERWPTAAGAIGACRIRWGIMGTAVVGPAGSGRRECSWMANDSLGWRHTAV